MLKKVQQALREGQNKIKSRNDEESNPTESESLTINYFRELYESGFLFNNDIDIQSNPTESESWTNTYIREINERGTSDKM